MSDSKEEFFRWSAVETIGIVPPNVDASTFDPALKAGVKAGTHRHIIRPGGVLSIVPVDYELREETEDE